MVMQWGYRTDQLAMGFFYGDILDDMYINTNYATRGVIWGIYEDMIYSILFILPHNWAPK
jgi:hypothetical protein